MATVFIVQATNCCATRATKPKGGVAGRAFKRSKLLLHGHGNSFQERGDSRDQQIRQALTCEELADRPPSVFLRRLQQLMPPTSVESEDPILRQLFLSRLPSHFQSALLPFRDKPLPELALPADQMLMMQAPSPLGHVSAARDVTDRLDRLEQGWGTSGPRDHSIRPARSFHPAREWSYMRPNGPRQQKGSPPLA
uniref:Uncharacterized protein n=1 Tax=Trichuris muris TaxID=70415 RepID=A0A5S6R4W3_TRIMR